MGRKIVVYIGVIGSGKDYNCSKLVKDGFKKIGFSDGVRNLTWKFLNWKPDSDEAYEKFKAREFFVFDETLTGREILQRVGTIMRNEDEDYWAHKWGKTVRNLIINGVGDICVSDCRYMNEVREIFKISLEFGCEVSFIFCNFKSERYEINEHESEHLAQKILSFEIYDGQDITRLLKTLSQ